MIKKPKLKNKKNQNLAASFTLFISIEDLEIALQKYSGHWQTHYIPVSPANI